MSELVSCICPTTAARVAWIPKMLACYAAQTYRERELVIVTEPADVGPIARLVNEWLPSSLCATVHPVPVRSLVGAKRNRACEYAAGELIAHFDDDDWSAPERLARQVARLAHVGAAMTGYSRMKFTDGQKWWRYADRDNVDFPLNTSLVYRKSWWLMHPFREDVHKGSDTLWIQAAQRAGQADAVECGDLMYANVHRGNLNQRSYQPPTFELLPVTEAVRCRA